MIDEEKKIRLKEAIKKFIRQYMAEESSTGTGASFSGGTGEQYASPKAFSKGGKNKGTEESEKEGWKTVSPKQRFKAKTFDVEKWHENKA